MFAYCLNNPTNHVDSTGHWPKWISNLYEKGKQLIKDYLSEKADNHYARNDLNNGIRDIPEILNTYEKQSEIADFYHENTSGIQGEDAKYNDKYLSPQGGHYEIIICEPPEKAPYIVDQFVDPLNMGTYNYASNDKFFLFYWVDHFVNDMVPYYFFGNTRNDEEGLLKWALD